MRRFLRRVAALFCVPLSILIANDDAPVTIPFELRHGIMWVQVYPGADRVPLKFMFDTGAEVSAVDRAVCKRLGISRRSTVQVAGVGGSVAAMWPVRFRGEIGGLAAPRKVLGLDLGPLSRAIGEKVHGILGNDFIRNRIVRIDFNERTIVVNAESQAQETSPGSIPLKQKSGGLLVPVRIDEAREDWFRIDTGCNSAMQFSDRKAALAATVRTLVVGMGEEEVGLVSVLAAIGGQARAPVEAVVSSRRLFPGEVGLIGTAFLTNYVVTLNLKTSTMSLESYSYSLPSGGIR